MEFIFEHDINGLLPFLMKVNRHIEDILPGRDDYEVVLNRCKFILTELCTNSIKHSGLQQSTFHIYVKDGHLVLERKENGNPFLVNVGNKKVTLPLTHEFDTVILTQDDVNRLTMQRIDEHNVRFYVDEISAAPGFEQQMMNEHFGLIIICLSSDSFIYSRTPGGQNVFTVSLKVL
jgi:anti-sigma regulatory factor (Ser/Thr protein kinase)